MRRIAFALCALAAGLAGAGELAITDVRIVDVEHGRAGAPRTVLVRDGRVVAVSEALRAEPDREVLDGSGAWLVPGYVDAHVHLFNNASRRAPNDWAFALFLAHGVTGVREMAALPADLAQVERWNAAIDARGLLAPRVLATALLSGGATREGIHARVEQSADSGAAFVKVFSDSGIERWRALRDAARTRSLRVVGHAPAATSLLDAVRAGLATNEHLMQAYEACSAHEDEWLASRAKLDGEALSALRDAQEDAVLASFDAARCARVARALARARAVQVPTAVLVATEARTFTGPPRDDALWPLLRSDEQARWLKYLAPEYRGDHRLAQRRNAASLAIVGAFARAGVPLLAGSDAPMPRVYPGDSLHEELALFVQAGMSPAAALRSATIEPARAFGVDADLGTIAVGKRADFVLLDADPLRDIRATRRIRAVVLGGRVLGRAELDAMLGK